MADSGWPLTQMRFFELIKSDQIPKFGPNLPENRAEMEIYGKIWYVYC